MSRQSGEVQATITNNFDECGGIITITWTAPTGCDNQSVQESATINIVPAAEPEITIPQIPGSLTCDEAADYVAPQASYSNGEVGTCAIEGFVDGVITPDFDICGGTRGKMDWCRTV